MYLHHIVVVRRALGVACRGPGPSLRSYDSRGLRLHYCCCCSPICSPIVSVAFRSRLRSADNDDVIVPRTRTARYGPRSFRVAASKIWNMLPHHLKTSSVSCKQFKSGLSLGSLCKPTHKRRL